MVFTDVSVRSRIYAVVYQIFHVSGDHIILHNTKVIDLLYYSYSNHAHFRTMFTFPLFMTVSACDPRRRSIFGTRSDTFQINTIHTMHLRLKEKPLTTPT